MFSDLLEPDYGVNTEPVDETMITQILLYLDTPDVAEFKSLAKELMKHYWPQTYKEEGNLSDLLLKLMRDVSQSIKAKKISY